MIAALARRFDFDFGGLTADHFEPERDWFSIRTKGKGVLEAFVTEYNGLENARWTS